MGTQGEAYVFSKTGVWDAVFSLPVSPIATQSAAQ